MSSCAWVTSVYAEPQCVQGLSLLAVLVTFPWTQSQGRGCLPIQLGVVGIWTWTQQNPWRTKA